MKSGWVTKKLGEVCDSFNGIWKGTQPPLKNVGVIRATNFTKQCEFDPSRTVFIDVEEKKFNKRKLEFGDIIVERSGGGPGQPVGRVIFFNLQDGDYTISNFTSALRVKDKTLLDPYYLHRALVAKYFSGATEKMQSNSIHIINLNYSAYLELEIPIPPLAEQKRIVAKIDAAFEKIDALKANAEKNLANAKELFQSALDEAMRPKKGWVEKRLGEVYNFIDYRGKTPTKIDNGIPLVTARNIRMGHLDYSVRDFISVDEYKTRQSRGIAHKGDILFTTEAPLGFVALADLDEFSTGQRVITFQQYQGSSLQLSNEFYYYYIQAKCFQDEIRKQATGATAQGIKASRLKDILIAVVPFAEQKQIARHLKSLYGKSKLLEQNCAQQIADCAEMRQAILREAFEGRL